MDAEIQSILAETVHTAFRKGCDNGQLVHAAINKLPAKDWEDAILWMIFALDFSGFEIVRKQKA